MNTDMRNNFAHFEHNGLNCKKIRTMFQIRILLVPCTNYSSGQLQS